MSPCFVYVLGLRALSVPQTSHVCCCPGAFALAVPSALSSPHGWLRPIPRPLERFCLTFPSKVTSPTPSHCLSSHPVLLPRWNLEPLKLSRAPSVGSFPVCLPRLGSLPFPQCLASGRWSVNIWDMNAGAVPGSPS